jgi:hypothetical protein
MCFPLFTLAFCAVFAQAPAQSTALAPAAAVSAAGTPAPDDASRAKGARGGKQEGAVQVVAVAQTGSDRREAASQSESRDTESKDDRGSSREADRQDDTEAK